MQKVTKRINKLLACQRESKSYQKRIKIKLEGNQWRKAMSIKILVTMIYFK